MNEWRILLFIIDQFALQQKDFHFFFRKYLVCPGSEIFESDWLIVHSPKVHLFYIGIRFADLDEIQVKSLCSQTNWVLLKQSGIDMAPCAPISLYNFITHVIYYLKSLNMWKPFLY